MTGRTRPRWLWLGFVPVIGFWAPFVATLPLRRLAWSIATFVPIPLSLIGFIVSSDEHNTSGGFIAVGWIWAMAATAAVWGIRSRARPSAFDEARRAASESIGEREKARRLAQSDPALARQMGVGRPDVPGAHHFGLVDVNAVPRATLAELPGVDDAAAGRIVDARDLLGGFTSFEDFVLNADIDQRWVGPLRDVVVIVAR